MYFKCLHFVLLGFFLEAINGQREKRGCPAPGLEGGFFAPEIENYPHGATINYRCDQGRKPNVDGWWATSTCQNGNWTQTPQCIDENDCLGPEIPNAKYTPPRRSFKDGETIRINCDEGFISDDIATATCGQGNWTSLPICYRDVFACTQPIEIQLPHAVIMHEYQTAFPDEETISYECKKGYSVAQGKIKSIMCALGSWDWDLVAPCNRDSAPGVLTPTGTGHALVPISREETDCPAPELEGGFVAPEKENYPHGTTINYRCDQGRKPNVEGWWATSTCRNGNWTQTPQCIDENDCLGPEIPNAEYTPPRRSFKDGETIKINCDEGYEIRDDIATTTCGQGNWTSLPICDRGVFACTQPAEIPHAVIMHEYQTTFPDEKTISYECKKGYSVAQGKSNSIVCSNGRWGDAECVRDSGLTGPALVPIEQCGDIPMIQDGKAKLARMSLTYQCFDSFKLVGTAVVVCYYNGSWSQPPTCTAISCGYPGDAEFAEISLIKGRSFVFGSEVEYTCQEGYQMMSSSNKRRCTRNGWDGVVPVCKDENDCLGPEIPNAQYIPPHGPYENGKQIRIECDEGYNINGTATATCRDGNWTTSPPICERDPDPPVPTRPAVPEDAPVLTGRGTGPPTEIVPVPGVSTRPAWTVRVPVERCGAYDPPTDNGIGDATRKTMRLTYQCQAYYQLVGPAEVFCYDNGNNGHQWSAIPTCRPDHCETPQNTFMRVGEVSDWIECNGGWTKVRCRAHEQLELMRCCSNYQRQRTMYTAQCAEWRDHWA